ncbi:hypothetical protein RvY_09559 [Ramazzottius varieornatus]|uniref:Uncharacterized protein n=1 Tax=Ramazzottius varieornatus TaxID=947166 RepID=A0A1D1VF83_RAMVA|nr:hypothetical protein RvY_09559 [Ramazzottius varieornatus]
MMTDGEILSSKDVRVISSWSCATDPTKDLVDFAQIHPDEGLFQIAEDDYLDELVGPETGFLLEDRSVTAGSTMHCPLKISCTRDLVGLLGVIVITNCEVIEVYGSLNAGYIQTSRGILLEKVDETVFYSHTLNFTKGPLLEIELKMVNRSTEKRFVTFFALHVYLTRLASSPRKALNDPSMLALFSGLMSAPAKIGQGDGVAAIAQEKDKMDQVRTEMQLMEQRLTTHIDKQFENMKKEIAKQFDQLLLRMQHHDPKS